MNFFKIVLVGMLLAAATVHAGEADVIEVDIAPAGMGFYDFNVTVRHADEGWKHYADKWDVVSSDGTVLGTRTLHHPHVDEQPFTRSLPGVKIPAGTDNLTVRAHDSVHGYGGKTVEVAVPR